MQRNLIKLKWKALGCVLKQTLSEKSLRPFILYLKFIYDALSTGHQTYLDYCENVPCSEEVRLGRLRQLTSGLHSLLQEDSRFSYSILISVSQPRPDFFRKTIESALAQTAPQLEVLVGLNGNQTKEILDILAKCKEGREAERQKNRPVLRVFQLESSESSQILNRLAAEAKYSYFFPLDSEAWIRPDLLYRYEQALRLSDHSLELQVLYCNETQLQFNDPQSAVYGGSFKKPSTLSFPYVFFDLIGQGMLVHRSLWEKGGGLRKEIPGAEIYDFCLRMHRVGAIFENIPLTLLSSPAGNWPPKSSRSWVKAMKDHIQEAKLNWKVEVAEDDLGCRVTPSLDAVPRVHVIIPFRDQGEITLKTVQGVLNQTGVVTHITAIDNRSTDREISRRLDSMGVEVISIDEPFNYSRLNNLGVARSKVDPSFDSVLFLNNDVELEEGAVLEMSRWLGQPGIGIVGCRLFFPNGCLQHGGVDLRDDGPVCRMNWFHTDHKKPPSECRFSRIPRVVDAVTAACALMRKDLFKTVAGFDETWYPVAYSDTSLALKIRGRGLKCFYTPFARGIHHESISRAKGSIEDFEESRWLFEKYLSRMSIDRSNEVRRSYETKFY